jgi:hypothetical protein
MNEWEKLIMETMKKAWLSFKEFLHATYSTPRVMIAQQTLSSL